MIISTHLICHYEHASLFFIIYVIVLVESHWSWNKTITAFAFVQYENLFVLENSYCTQDMT